MTTELKSKKVSKSKLAIPSELNEDQVKCYKSLLEFIQSGTPEMLLLQGYAGTGKTYLITKFIKYITESRENQMIAMTAPTNKAVKVLKRSASFENHCIHYGTIHSLLGLREQITENGDQIFVESQTDSPNIINFQFLIVDEVSMLSDDLFIKIEKYRSRIKIIFVGDSAQIPPVMRHDCIPFVENKRDQYNIKLIQLDKIMRQKSGNPIIEIAAIVRENLLLSTLPINRENRISASAKDGIINVNNADENERQSFIMILETYFTSDYFKQNSDYAKVLSWTNKSVSQMNVLIRKMIFGNDLKRIMIGEKLIANKPIIEMQKKIGKVIIFSTNDEFEVISYEILTDERFFFYYDTIVEETLLSGEKRRKKIKILHEESYHEFNKKLNEIKKSAIKEHDSVKKSSEWRWYYDFMGLYADVGYNYAITCHKSQGSSYVNCFVLEDDIDQNKKIIERNRIKYTAFTRSSEKLFIVKRQ